MQSRPRTSLTPTRAAVGAYDSRLVFDGDDSWGDDAVLQWEGGIAVDSDDDVSSVLPEDAGLSEEDEDSWGRGAIIDYTYTSQENGPSESEASQNMSEDEILVAESSSEPHVETMEDLIARGMPDYPSWAMAKLQVR